MKKKLLFLFCCISFFVEGQVTFQKGYGTIRNESANDIITFNDNSSVVSANNYMFPDSGFLLLKINEIGNVVWSKRISTTFYNQGFAPFHLEKTYDQNILVSYSNLSEFILIKLDTAGNLIWSNSYSIPSFPGGFYRVYKTRDLGFILWASYNDSIDRWLILKTDSLGNSQWCKSYNIDSSSSLIGQSFVQTDDGNFLMSGIYEPNLSSNYFLFTMKLDTLGNAIHSFATNYLTFGGGLSSHCYRTGSNSFIEPSPYSLICYDSLGSVLWQEQYDNFQALNSCVVKSSGHLFCNGYYYDSLQYIYPGFIETDSLGNIVQSFINSINPSELDFIDSLSDGSIVSAGSISGPDSTDIYIVKADSSNQGTCNMSPVLITHHPLMVNSSPITLQTSVNISTVVTYTQTILPVILNETTYCYNINSTSNLVSTDKVLVISPNPFHTTATLIINNSENKNYELKIYNTMGALVESLHGNTSSEIKIDRKNLSDGLYFFQLTTSGMQSATRKFVIE